MGSVVITGTSNTANGIYAQVLAGSNNDASGAFSVVVAGEQGETSGQSAGILRWPGQCRRRSEQRGCGR